MNPMPPNWRKRPERISPETTCYYEPRESDLRVLVEVVVPVGETRGLADYLLPLVHGAGCVV